MGGNVSSVQTLDRIVKILDCFCYGQPTWTLSQLSTRLDLPKSTLHRLLGSLEANRFLRRSDDEHSWQLGYRLVPWGRLAQQGNSLPDLARPVMRELTTATGETAVLVQRAGLQVVCSGVQDTPYSRWVALEVGKQYPAHAGAWAKALAAYRPDEELAHLLGKPQLARFSRGTITQPAEFLSELERIRLQGYALSVEEWLPDLWGIAAVVVDYGAAAVAAIGIAGPLLRFREEAVPKWAASCRRAAGRISTVLGAA